MDRRAVLADPPDWALEAGLPAPTQGEPLVDYVVRLGLSEEDQEWLWVDLIPQTAVMANNRLGFLLTKILTDSWEAHRDARIKAAIPDERLRFIRKFGR